VCARAQGGWAGNIQIESLLSVFCH